MRLMALDVGDRRIGVALSDPGRVLARSLGVIRRRSLKADMEVMRSLVEEHEVDKIVVGHPLGLDGGAGMQARRAENYGVELERVLGIPVVLWDEAFSTDRAQQVMIEAGRRRKEREERLDAVAAAVILQDYLDSLGQDHQ